jgi:hypothetical protein
LGEGCARHHLRGWRSRCRRGRRVAARPSPSRSKGRTPHSGFARCHSPEIPRRISQWGARRGPVGDPQAPICRRTSTKAWLITACRRRSSRLVYFAPTTGHERALSSTHRDTLCWHSLRAEHAPVTAAPPRQLCSQLEMQRDLRMRGK